MSATASIIFSMGICALWAVILAVAAYSVPACRPVRRLLLVLALFLLAKDLVAYLARETDWLPGSESRPPVFELYRILMAVSGVGVLLYLLLRVRRKAEPSSKAEKPAPPEMPVDPPHVVLAEVAEDDSLLSRFQSLLLEQELFLRPQLTLPEVAELLHTNKTYLSKVVNDHYKISFPELINTLRIDYAEQYILSHREARQEEIARACGFSSASSFNITFKKVVGMPPKQWVTNWDASHRD